MGSKRIYHDDGSGVNPEASPENAPPPGVVEAVEDEGKSEADRLLDKLRAETAPEVAEGLLAKLEAETNERKRVELLRSMLSDQDVETLSSNLAVLKKSPDVLDESKVAALAFLTDELLYVLPRVMAEKPDLDPTNLEAAWMGIYLMKDPSTNKRDARVVPLVQTLKYLHGQRGTKWVKAYLDEVYPQVVEQAKKLTGPASEVVDEVRQVNDGKEGKKTKMRDWMEKNPIMTTAGLAIGAYAGARILHLAYKKLRERQQKREAAGKKVHGKKFFGFVDKITGFFDKLAGPALIASLGVITAGSILSIDEVEKFLKKNGHEGIYDNKAIAALVELLRGHPDEAIATFIHGPRSGNEKSRQERYAKYFGVEEKHVWVLGPVKFKDFIDADLDRTTSLVASKFGKLPILGGLFESPEQVESEKKIRNYFTDNDIQVIRANLEGADGKTMNEVLQFAFTELYIFDIASPPHEAEAAGDRAEAGEETGRDKLAGELNKETKGLMSQTEGIKDKDVLLEEDVELLRKLHLSVNQELLDLQSTVPDRMTRMKEVLVKTFHSIIPEDEIDPADMVATREQYNVLFGKTEEDEMTAIAEDLTALEEGREFFEKLKAGKPLSKEEKVKLRKHVAKMNEVYRDIRTAIKDVKNMRAEVAALDIAEGNTDRDVFDGLMIWGTGYKEVIWGVAMDAVAIGEEGMNIYGEEDADVSRLGLAISGFAVKGLVLNEAARGVHMAFTGTGIASRIRGVANVVAPGSRHLRPLSWGRFMWEAKNGLAYSEKRLLDSFFSGKMGRTNAQTWARRAKSYRESWGKRFHVKAETPIAGDFYASRLSYWDDMIRIFEKIQLSEFETIATHPDAHDFDKFRSALKGRIGDDTLESLRRIVKERFGMEWDEFVKHVRQVQAKSGGKLMESTPSLRHVTFAKFNRFSYMMAEKLGFNKIPTDKLKEMFPGVQKFLKENAGRTLSYSALLLMAYWTCNAMYHDKEKGTAIVLAAAGTGGAVAGGRLGVMAAARLGLPMGLRAPGPWWGKALVGLGVFVAGVVGFELSETAAAKFLRQREGASGVAANVAKGALAPNLHMLTAGSLFDIGLWKWNDDMKQHFMSETYLLGGQVWKGFYKAKPAFGYNREQRTPEQAIAVWNSDIQGKINEAESEGDGGEVAELKEQLINEDWIDKSICDYNVKKRYITSIGLDLYGVIIKEIGEENLTPEQKAHCSSLLAYDTADSWAEDEHRTIEDDPRYVTVKALLGRIEEQKGGGVENQLENFVTFKRDIVYDKKFYGVIGMTERVVNAKEDEVARIMDKDSILMTALGLNEDQFHAAQEVIGEMESEGGMDDFELLDEAV